LKHLYKIIFLSVIAVLLFSESSYAQWKKVNIPPGYESDRPFLEVMFLKSNPKLGWICGFYGRVLRTVDGGNTWTGTRIADGYQLESILFLDSLNGYTSGSGKIFKSTDGGVRWFDVTDKDHPIQVWLWGNYFVTKDIGMVIGGGCEPETQKFFRTTNGGMTWSLYERNEFDSGLTDIFLSSANGLGYAVSSGRLWRTTNGGLTWDIVAITGGNDWQEELAISGNTFLLPYSTGCSGNGNDGGLRISTDGGVNWKQFNTGNRMFGAYLLDAQRGWGVGWERKAYYTSNGGNTWILRNCGIEPNEELDDIWFIDDTTGWVVGYKVYKTFNYDTLNPVITATATNKCEGDSVILTVLRDYPHYDWSTGETSKSIVVKKSGTYYITVSNTECDSTKSNAIKITFHPSPQPQILVSDTIICENDSARLSLSKSYSVIQWSNGENSQIIYVMKDGMYSVTVIDSNGCVGTASQYVKVVPNPEPVITKISPSVSCVGDSIFLETSPTYSEFYWYNADKNQLVSTGKNKIKITEDGHYYVTVKNAYGCIGVSDTVQAKFVLDSNRIKIDILSSSLRQFPFDSTNLLGIICKKLRIRNIGPDTEIINDISILRNIEFSIPQTQFPITLLPYESFDLEICYAPSTLGEQYDTLVLSDHCFPHLLPLLGVGKPNIYGGGSKCDIPVELISTGLYGYLLNVSPPLPNPSGSIVTLEFARFVADGENSVESCKIYNTLGSESATGNFIIQEQISNLNGIISSGAIKFDVQHLADGLYYVIIKAKNYNYIYPVIINK